MKSYYSVQTSENTSVRIPMVGALTSEQALLLGALVAKNNSHLVSLMEKRGNVLLGCLIGSLIEGEDVDFDSQEAVSLSKMLVSDVVSLLFQAFETIEQSLAAAGWTEESESEAIEEYEAEAQEESEASEAVEPSEDDN